MGDELSRHHARFEEPELSPEQEWVAITRKLFTEINKHDGVDLTYRLPTPAKMEGMSQAEQESAAVLADNAAAERKGFHEAMSVIKPLVVSGKVRTTDARVWKTIFAIGKLQFRPKFGEVESIVRDCFDVREVSGGDATARSVVSAPVGGVLGIPGTTVQAAFKDVTKIPKNAQRIEDIPERDDQGNLIGIGRRKFMLSMARMKQDLRPLPSDLFDEGEGIAA